MYAKIPLAALAVLFLISGAHANQSEYFNERVACEAIMHSFNQSRLTGRANIEQVKQKASLKQLETKVSLNMKKEWLLNNYFNIKITPEQIDREFQRIELSTKDKAGLQRLFKAFNDDFNKIAECVIRPLIVEKIFVHEYGTNDAIHSPTKQVAVEDISSGEFLAATHRPITESTNKSTPPNELTESLYSFTYEDIGTIYQWPKEIESKWIKRHAPDVVNINLAKIKTIITLNKSAATLKSAGTGDYWEHTEIMPQERSGHTAIWTGSEMIVWGGESNDGKLDTGGRYDPVTDSWLPITLDDAPFIRRDHSAVWTGTHMIIWGGNYAQSITNPSYTDTGAKYNPVTNKWSPIQSPGTSVAKSRGHHTAIWTGSEMIVYGGTNGFYSLDGARYNPTTDAWTHIAGSARYNHTAIWTGSEMIIFGGKDNTGHIAAGAKWEPGSNSWTDLPTIGAPAPRSDHTVVWSGDEMILWGGTDEIGRTKSGSRYNPATNEWSPTRISSAPQARSNHTSIWTGSQMIIWGGTQSSGLALGGGRYNPVTDSWQSTASSNRPDYRQGHTAVWTGDKMILWGGESTNGYLDTGSKYDPQTDKWVSTKYFQRQTVKRYHTAVWTGNEMVAWGGTQQSTNSKTNTGFRYNPVTNSFIPTATNNAPSARNGHVAVWTGTHMIVTGGDGGESGARYNPLNNSWTAIAPLNERRYDAVGIWAGDRLILWGGDFHADTAFMYNPSNNTWTESSVPAEKISSSGMSVIWGDGEMIIWGGMLYSSGSNGPTNKGAKYNPFTDTWQPTTTQWAPSKRIYHSAVWTGDDMLIGGGQYSGSSGGSYDPYSNIWNAVSNTSKPESANRQTGVWSGSELIVWGGSAASGQYQDLNTGARLNKQGVWKPVTTVNAPNARRYHTAVWADSGMIVSGGKEGVAIYYPQNPDIIFANNFE